MRSLPKTAWEPRAAGDGPAGQHATADQAFDSTSRSGNMTTTASAQPETRTLDVLGATLTYDVRRNEASKERPLFLIGSPMGAGGFPTLAGHFADRTVITYDPRGTERSTANDPAEPITPDV